MATIRGIEDSRVEKWLDKLQDIWDKHDDDEWLFRNNRAGIYSRQIAALVRLLVQEGILK